MSDLKDRLWTPANVVTIARICVFPIIIGLAYWDAWAVKQGNLELSSTIALWNALLFSAAFITDYLDGYLARSRGEVSTFGSFLDPLSDKVLMTTGLIMIVMLGRAPAWVAVIIILREMAITGLRTLASGEGIVISASKWGKIKTNLQGFSIAFCMGHYPHHLLWWDSGPLIPFGPMGAVLLYVALVSTVMSGYHYFDEFFKAVYAEGPDETNDEGDPSPS
ncbi:MAG: CDP-diacylglycerol--glycerol-3-phosphate 3-phosphatidyltransferase [Deltaproteobacteria bacterium]|nr:CDP-diacylglycerol--glycerol-3-phosphate 3-phosphatidyltransferase [Deltaproteobacteria bacterium]